MNKLRKCNIGLATKTLPKLNKLKYIDRLKKLKLTCLKYRRLREDLIEAYKILKVGCGSYLTQIWEFFFVYYYDLICLLSLIIIIYLK